MGRTRDTGPMQPLHLLGSLRQRHQFHRGAGVSGQGHGWRNAPRKQTRVCRATGPPALRRRRAGPVAPAETSCAVMNARVRGALSGTWPRGCLGGGRRTTAPPQPPGPPCPEAARRGMRRPGVWALLKGGCRALSSPNKGPGAQGRRRDWVWVGSRPRRVANPRSAPPSLRDPTGRPCPGVRSQGLPDC